MLRLITDFDGPIVDVSERYYQVYQYCLETTKQRGQPVRQLSKGEFWQLKRAKVPEKEIGAISGLDEAQAAEFSQLRRQKVHTMPYFAYDRLLPEAEKTLERIQSLGFDLAVMTMRRTRELAFALEQYHLSRFFPSKRRYCLGDDDRKTVDVKDKPLLMARALQELPPVSESWMVGDTEADIIAAKTHGIKAIAVLSGIRDRAQLEPYEPDFIVDNLAAAVDLVVAVAAT